MTKYSCRHDLTWIPTWDMGWILGFELGHGWKMEKTMECRVLLLDCGCGGKKPIYFESDDSNKKKFMDEYNMAASFTNYREGR